MMFEPISPKPCPFCGCDKTCAYGKLDFRLHKVTVGNDKRKREGYVFRVVCPDCEAKGPCCANQKEAIRYWNGIMSMYCRSRDVVDLY